MLTRRACGVLALGAAALPLGARAAGLKPLRVAIGLSLPPYVISDENRGMEYDVVKEALAAAGYDMVPVYADFGEVPGMVAAGTADAAMTINPDSGLDAAFSEVHNVAVTLAARGLVIERIADLGGKSIVAFQNARVYLPPGYKVAVARNENYREVAEQYLQDIALYGHVVDVVVADINIFTWFAHDPRVTGASDTSQAITVHEIFPPTPYRVAFQDPAIRDGFDAALAGLHASGRYGEIVAAYGGVE